MMNTLFALGLAALASAPVAPWQQSAPRASEQSPRTRSVYVSVLDNKDAPVPGLLRSLGEDRRRHHQCGYRGDDCLNDSSHNSVSFHSLRPEMRTPGLKLGMHSCNGSWKAARR